MSTIKPMKALITDYLGFVQPKLVQGKNLTELEKIEKAAIDSALKGDVKGYKNAEELIGRLITNKNKK